MKDMKCFWPVAWVCLVICAACGGTAERQPTGTGERRYRTTPPSLLYFKNMRSANYTVAEQPESRIELYHLNKYSFNPGEPTLYPVIANNWLEDEAYLFLKTNSWRQGFHDPLTVSQDTAWSGSLFTLQPPTPGQQYELALTLYESLKEGEAWYVAAADSTFAPLFSDADERVYYLTTVRDYLKLTDSD